MSGLEHVVNAACKQVPHESLETFRVKAGIPACDVHADHFMTFIAQHGKKRIARVEQVAIAVEDVDAVAGIAQQSLVLFAFAPYFGFGALQSGESHAALERRGQLAGDAAQLAEHARVEYLGLCGEHQKHTLVAERVVDAGGDAGCGRADGREPGIAFGQDARLAVVTELPERVAQGQRGLRRQGAGQRIEQGEAIGVIFMPPDRSADQIAARHQQAKKVPAGGAHVEAAPNRQGQLI